jgi:Cu(I)/Ag(I) efflux system membrane fusion protein/cobalt-zinc-cadmium efflux system membrane fusion protein
MRAGSDSDRTNMADVRVATNGSTPSQGKQLYTCGMHPQVLQDRPGNCPICHMKLTPLKSDSVDGTSQSAGTQAKRKILYWWDPMLGPSSISDKPGKSAMGMEMVPVYEGGESAGPAVKIDPTIVQNMGIRTAEAVRGPLNKSVRAVGIIESPETGLFDVTLKINGFIDKLLANQEGMHVHKGDPLFAIYSSDLQIAEEELISAERSLRSLDSGAAEQVRKESENLIASAKRKLKLWDIADEDIDAIAKADKPPKTIMFRSPASGEVVEKMIVEGSSVQAGMKLMRIEDHAKMWLKVQIYEEQIPLVKLGQTVEATVDALPGETFSGPITFVYPHLDHMSRTSTVRVTLDNPDMKLRPGMYATAKVQTQPVADAILVPREAVIDTGSRQIAFVVTSDGRFDPRKVRMGVFGDDDSVQILEGLSPGDMVVTSGQFLLDVESRTTEAINKLRSTSSGNAPVAMATSDMAPMVDDQKPGTTKPSQEAQSLVVANCPMKKADWIQVGEKLSNPFFGSSMLTCGDVTRKLTAPAEGSELAGTVKEYLNVGRALSSDKVDSEAVGALKAAADKLAGDKFSALRQASTSLLGAKDIEAARIAFKAVSAEVIRALDTPAR